MMADKGGGGGVSRVVSVAMRVGFHCCAVASWSVGPFHQHRDSLWANKNILCQSLTRSRTGTPFPTSDIGRTLAG
jgi:hypothetical protein